MDTGILKVKGVKGSLYVLETVPFFTDLACVLALGWEPSILSLTGRRLEEASNHRVLSIKVTCWPVALKFVPFSSQGERPKHSWKFPSTEMFLSSWQENNFSP